MKIFLNKIIMKKINNIFKTLLILFFGLQYGMTQDGTLELENGITIGNSTNNTDGTIRYDGVDFEARKGGIWTSLTAAGSSMWSQNGADVYFDTGNVGVGTNTPLVEFHIDGDHEVLRLSGFSPWLGIHETGQTNYGFNWMTGGDFKIGVTGDHDIAFLTNFSEKLRIKSSGNVGIGTASPGAKLDVRGSAIFNELGAATDFRIESDNDANMFFVDGTTNNIGIGTGTPIAKLHIVNDTEAIRLEGINPWLSFYNGATYNGYLYHNSTDMIISNEVVGDLSFKTSGNTRMKINESGNVGIGTGSPVAKLDVRGSAIFNENGIDADFRVESNGQPNMLFVDGSSNRVGIGTDSPTAELEVIGAIGFGSSERISDGGSSQIKFNGTLRPSSSGQYDLGSSSYKWDDIWAVNGTIQTSDKNLKTNIEDLQYGLKEIMKLKPVKFQWKDSHNKDFKLGLLAQDLLPVLSEVVKTHHYEVSEEDNTVNKVELDKLGVYYSDIIPVLIKGIQEQQTLIQSQQSELEYIKEELTALREFVIENSSN